MRIFSGFSTKNKNSINHVLTGKDLVVEDLMNHIMTRKGERVMMPTFGSIVHEMIFEPLTSEVKGIIFEDIKSIIEDDPRVTLISLNVSDEGHAVNVEIKISIKPSNEVTTLSINLERE